ncbi:Imidazolonepropionase [Microbacterium sp. cf046]|uniref:amidohydrolase family protein n=1 Tax=Microbacterium sp. cf046 TaxID=1761803 RepID=UPI0008F1313A|nr:amidohydrolase family protein [Microbacterium sp. cf046]SFR92695.1 Imidazolonepropionase [Microbacterium sp. cf046]
MATVLRNVHVYDGDGFTDARDVVIDGEVIAGDAGPDADIVDGAGGFLVPGFIDCHIHLAGPHTQELLMAAGVTTGLDMSSPAPLVKAMRGRAGVTDIRSAMMAMSSPASAHAQRMKDIPAAQESLVAGPADAEAAVARRVDQGADYLKIVIDLPGFEQADVDALVAAAHARGLRTVAHASRSDAVAMAETAGIDVLTHAPLDRPIDQAQAERLAAAGTVIVPTLTMMKGIVDRVNPAGGPGPTYAPARESVRALHAAGVPILAGTDANETPAAPASPPFGSSLHDELALLVEAGLTPVEALRSATSVAAEHFGLDDRGVIAPGLRADLVLLSADPTVDITATRSIRGVWLAGDRVVDEA